MTDARANFADLVNRVAYTGESIALTRRGKVMAAIISPEDYELLKWVREQHIDLTQAGPAAPAGADQQAARPGPLRIAAEHRPEGSPRPPGFTR